MKHRSRHEPHDYIRDRWIIFEGNRGSIPHFSDRCAALLVPKDGKVEMQVDVYARPW